MSGRRRLQAVLVGALLAIASFDTVAAATGPFTLPHFDSYSRSRSYGCSSSTGLSPGWKGTNAEGTFYDCSNPGLVMHAAIDFVLTYDPVVASMAGIVVDEEHGFSDYTGSGCSSPSADPNFILIDHQNGLFTRYVHLKKGSNLVFVGDEVSAGQKIATSGESGYVCGAHLHYVLSDSTSLSLNRTLNPDGDWTTSTGRRPWVQDFLSQTTGTSVEGSWDLCYGATKTWFVKYKNVGGRTWSKTNDAYGRGRIALYVTNSSGSAAASSSFKGSDWESSSIVGGADTSSVAADGTATFTFNLAGNAAAGQTYTTYFNLRSVSLYWFKYGSANEFHINIYVVPHQACGLQRAAE